MLSKPIYALTKDRSKKALVNNICGEPEELIKLISDCDGVEKSRRLYLFLRHQKIKEKYMLFKDVPED